MPSCYSNFGASLPFESDKYNMHSFPSCTWQSKVSASQTHCQTSTFGFTTLKWKKKEVYT
jgi:hypothetical protein